MILTLDIGNSRIKWARWERNEKTASGAGAHRDAGPGEVLRDAIEAAPERILVACVAGGEMENAVNAWCGENRAPAPEYLRSGRSACGVVHGYDDPRQHGVDRWAALLGARSLTHAPLCLIDAGTAVTIDWMNAEGVHQGGLIMPGLNVMRAALVQAAGGISIPVSRPEAERAGPHAPVARSTEAAVEDGTLLMLKSALRENLENARARYGDELIAMITGGMAGLIGRLPGLPAMRHEPDLVHRGLLAAFHVTPTET